VNNYYLILLSCFLAFTACELPSRRILPPLHISPYSSVKNFTNKSSIKHYHQKNNQIVNASLVSSEYKKISPTRGQWSGWLEGKGPVELKLTILDSGVPISTRYMGKVTLMGRSIPFEYESFLPKQKKWNWEISVLPN
jgi:hypothetical protein